MLAKFSIYYLSVWLIKVWFVSFTLFIIVLPTDFLILNSN